MGLERPTRCLSVCVRWCKARPAAPKSHLADVCLLSFSGCLKQQHSIKLDIRNLFLTIRVGLQGCSCLKNLPGGRILAVSETTISQVWWSQQRLSLPWGKEVDWMSLSRQETGTIWHSPVSLKNSPQHPQCWLPHSVVFSQKAVHHPDHLCCLSPHIFTKEVMLSSICCCLKLGLNVCFLTSTFKNTLNQLWIRSFSPAGRS